MLLPRGPLKERQMLAVFFARALGWESDRLHTRKPIYKRLPLFQSGPPIHISTQGSASLTASLHPGLRSLTPSAYFLKMPQLQSFFYAKQMPAASQAAAGEFGCQSLD